jgi:hypothetical protein
MVWGARRQGKVLGKLKQSHLEPYPAPEKAAKVLAHLVRYSEYLGVASLVFHKLLYNERACQEWLFIVKLVAIH